MIEFYKDENKEWRWKVVASNGKIVADSAEGYKNKKDAQHGLRVAVQTLLVAVGDYMEAVKL